MTWNPAESAPSDVSRTQYSLCMPHVTSVVIPCARSWFINSGLDSNVLPNCLSIISLETMLDIRTCMFTDQPLVPCGEKTSSHGSVPRTKSPDSGLSSCCTMNISVLPRGEAFARTVLRMVSAAFRMRAASGISELELAIPFWMSITKRAVRDILRIQT